MARWRVALAVLLGGVLGGLVPAPRPAFATKNLTTPYVNEGTLTFGSKNALILDDENDGSDHSVRQRGFVSYGVNNFWQPELEADYFLRNGDGHAEFRRLLFKNKFQLTQPGQWPVDFGVRLIYSYVPRGPEEAELDLLFSKKTERFQTVANLVAEREFGGGADNDMNYSVQGGTRYLYAKGFNPGFEAYSGFGRFNNNFSNQDHSIGPAIYGKLGSFSYDLGVLAGLSTGAPDLLVKGIVSYGITF